MDKTFKNILILNGLVARVRTRPSGKNKLLYEIRFRARGYSIIVCDSSFENAKAKFLAKISPNEIDKCKASPSRLRRKGKHLFYQLFQEWISLKHGNIGEKAIKRFESNFNNLPEELRYMPIFEIRAIGLDKILKDVKPRKYEELRTLFNGIFKYAVASGIIQNNPVALIKFKRAESQNREALSEDEIKVFLGRIIYQTITKSARRHLDYTSARLRRAVKVSSLFIYPFDRLKDRKNGGFRADPLAKSRRFSFFGNTL